MTLMLVDDDVEMIEMLRGLVDWTQYGYEQVFTAAGGPEALKAVGNSQVDLLITDIGMPVMDGYELSRSLKDKNPELKIVFLTCHEDFDHAKKAITVGADDYLLKYALTEKSLVEVICSIEEKRKKTRPAIAEESRYEEVLSEGRNHYKERLIYRILAGQDPLEMVLHKMDTYGIKRPEGTYCLIGFFADYDKRRFTEELEKAPEIWNLDSTERIEKIFLEVGEEVFFYDRFLLLFHECSGKKDMILPTYQQCLSGVLKMLNSSGQIHIQLCASDIYSGLHELKNAVADIKRRSIGSFYVPIELKSLEADPDFAPMSAEEFNDYYRRFKQAVPEETAFNKQMEALCHEIVTRKFEPAIVRKLFRAFDSGLRREAARIGCESSDIMMKDMSFLFLKEALSYQYRNLTTGRELLLNVSSNEDINQVLRYIAGNLDKKITLQSAADHIYKNSSYLSRLFKQHIGMSFTDYLIKLRIEKATRLLADSCLTAEEISEQIGIDNVNYFYQFYKRETGRTPRSGRGDGNNE